MAEILGKERQEKNKPKIIYKRCLKNFTKEKWKECLTMKRLERQGETEVVETMARDFNVNFILIIS